MNSKALEEAVKNRLASGGAIATGIGVFAVITARLRLGCCSSLPGVLLRKRKEKGSIVGQDLSGKWELPGGGMKMEDILPGQDGYLGSIAAMLRREIAEETGLNLSGWEYSGVAFLAMFAKQDEKQSLIDIAFSVPIQWQIDFETPEFQAAIERGEIRWVPIANIGKIEFVSPRMQFIIRQGLEE